MGIAIQIINPLVGRMCVCVLPLNNEFSHRRNRERKKERESVIACDLYLVDFEEMALWSVTDREEKERN